MLVITYRPQQQIAPSHRVSFGWHVGEEFPERKPEDIDGIQADGDELEVIRTVLPELAIRERVEYWDQPFASLIYKKLLATQKSKSRQAYIFLEKGDRFEKGDEYLFIATTGNSWKLVYEYLFGQRYDIATYMIVRRKVK